jgi:hypothetical protein
VKKFATGLTRLEKSCLGLREFGMILLFLVGLPLSTYAPARAQNVPQSPIAVPTMLSVPSAPPLSQTSPSASAEPNASPTPPTGRRLAAFSLSAQRIAFYSNRYVIEGDGNASVVMGDGTRVTGNTFWMDLRLNRFLVAGNVKLVAGASTYEGAAFAEFLDFDRAYFLPILSEPDRWTFAAGDYTHPLLGREMPGDTFFLPDLSGQSVFAYSKKVVIDPRQSVRFTPADLNFGLTFVPFPSYFLNFSTNPNFAQNSLPGATADGPLDFAGGEHGLATAHLRYDQADNVYFAYEQHVVSNNSYIVGSISPLTRPFKQYNLLAFDRVTPKLQGVVTFQESAFQSGFSQPLSATAVATGQLTLGLPHSYLQLTDNAYYESLLGQPPPGFNDQLYYGDPSHNWVANHPNDLLLSWTGFRFPVYKLPVYYQLRSSFGVNHQDFENLPGSLGALQTLGGVNYQTSWDKAVGVNLTTRSLTVLRDPKGLRRDLYFTASFDKQRQWFSVPHHIDTTVTNLSFTKLIDPQKLALLVSYTNTNVGDFYGAQQTDAYPIVSYFSPVNGQIFPSYLAFRGFGTTRSYAQQLNFTPNQRLTVTFAMRENRDFPEPVVGPLQILGGTPYFDNYGFSPYQATLDVRFRFNQILVLDVARSYYFNFGGFERWSPSFQFQVLK